MGKRKIPLTTVFLILAGIAFPATSTPSSAGTAGLGWEDGIAARKGKATTIAELAAMYDSTACTECHKEIHDDWAKSIHSRSIFSNGRTAATFRTAVINGLMEWRYSGVKGPEDVKVEHLMGCAKCHLPQLADATDDVAREIVGSIFAWQEALRNRDAAAAGKEAEKLKSLNINCLICHNRNAVVHKWTDGYPKAGEVYGSKEGSHDSAEYPVLKKSPVMAESIQCGQCHGLGPNLELDNPTQCCTSYGSYLWAYRAEGGRETCQECHMRKSGLGHNMQAYRHPGMAKAAVDFRAEAYPVVWRDGTLVTPKAVVKIEMTNRAGHSIPDG
jgi:hypothetical protein